MAAEHEDQLEQATRAYRKAVRTLADRRGDLHQAVTAAVAAGMTKSEVARRTGYTREYVTLIVAPKP